jgi:hypothetical protein
MRAVSRICVLYPGICLTTEEKARKNQSQGKTNLSQVNKNLRVHYTYYQDTHTLQNRHKQTHTHTHTHTHITKQYKTTTVQIKTKTVQDLPK